MKVNPMVIEGFVEPLDLLDENGAFDQVQTMSPKVLEVIKSMEVQPFGFTAKFKEAMLEQFEKLEDGESYVIVNSYLTPETPESKFWWEYLKQLHLGVDKDKAKELADAAHKKAHAEYVAARKARRESSAGDSGV
jgi:hypothetical protein